MKISNIKYIALGIIAAALSFQACSDDEHYDMVGNPNNLVYFKSMGDATTTCTVTHTPVGDFGEVSAKFSVAIQRAASRDTKVTAVIDNSLIDTYNTQHNTEYKAVPEGVVDAQKLSVTIAKDTIGSKEQIEVSIPSTAFAQLTEQAYLLPVRLSSVEGDGTASGQRGTAYVIINTQNKLVHAGVAAGDMPGTLMSDYSGVTASYTAGGTVDDMAQLFDGNLENGTALRSDEQDGKGTTLVFDLGTEQKVIGLRMARYYKSYWGGYWFDEYYFSHLDMQYSADGSTWNDMGSVDEADMVKSGGYQYLALYGAVPMRYLKIQFKSGSSSVSSLAELGFYTQQ